jgi:acyl-CoA dehydrogenase
MANWLLSGAGLPVFSGPLTAAPVNAGETVQLERTHNGWTLTGSVRHVGWARQAKGIVVLGHAKEGLYVALVDPSVCRINPGQNLAGEPRDTVSFDALHLPESAVAPAGEGVDDATLWHWGALTRSVMMAGALERMLELTVTYSKERLQFGRPIGRFQAIQQQLAVMAGEVAAAGVAADFAIDAFETGTAMTEIMVAKTRIGEAASASVPIAHQVHGAIGFTDEHALHQTTRRLWSWRDEYGTESDWAGRLGEMVMGSGPENLWSFVTGASK